MVRRLTAVAIAVACVWGIAAAQKASAYDAYPCEPKRGNVQICPDWSPDNWIPVYYLPHPESGIVDWIYAPGDDWYYYQCAGSIYTLSSYQNNWWAVTKGDGRYLGGPGHGRTGWVPETYFRGGANFERDDALWTERACPP